MMVLHQSMTLHPLIGWLWWPASWLEFPPELIERNMSILWCTSIEAVPYQESRVRHTCRNFAVPSKGK